MAETKKKPAAKAAAKPAAKAAAPKPAAKSTVKAGGVGRIARVNGPVVDIEYPHDAIPAIYNALTTVIDMGGEKTTLTLEVAQHLGDDLVRAIALKPTDGLVRGGAVQDTGAPISVPVGDVTKGHVFNVTGDVLNAKPGEKIEVTVAAKGGGEMRILRHRLRNAVGPVVLVFCLQLGMVLTGTVLTEAVFGWPGVGSLLVEGLNESTSSPAVSVRDSHVSVNSTSVLNGMPMVNLRRSLVIFTYCSV